MLEFIPTLTDSICAADKVLLHGIVCRWRFENRPALKQNLVDPVILSELLNYDFDFVVFCEIRSFDDFAFHSFTVDFNFRFFPAFDGNAKFATPK